LVTREIAPLFNRKSILDVPNGHCDLLGKFGGAVNGNNGTAKEAVKALERLTTQGGLTNLTMLLSRDFISATPLLRRTQAWCEECLRDWLNKGPEAYDPLLWSLSAVQICATHKKPLLDTCSQCHRTHYPLASRLQIGYCPWCCAWLAGKAVDTRPDLDGKVRSTPWETFSAESTAALIGDLSKATLTTGNSHSYFKDNVSNLVEKLFAGSENAMADYTGTHRVSVCAWSSGKQMPSLRAVLVLAYRFNISPSTLLLTPLDEAKASLRLPASPADKVFLRPPLKRTSPNKIEQTLRAALEHPTWPPSSLRSVCAKAGFHQTQATKRFPDLTRKICDSHRDYRLERRRQGEFFIKMLVRSAVYEVCWSGQYPSLSKVQARLAPSISLRDPLAKAEFRAAIRELGLGVRTTGNHLGVKELSH
jgi:hypothetical protein